MVLAEYASPYRVGNAAVGHIDSGITVNVAVSEGEAARSPQPPESIYNCPVCDIYRTVIIHIAEKGYAEFGLCYACIAVVIAGNGQPDHKRAAGIGQAIRFITTWCCEHTE